MNIEKYNQVFFDTFEINDVEVIKTFEYHGNEKWDSIGHMVLCANLEDVFGIHLEGEDILQIQSYKSGLEVLTKYGVEF